MSGLSITKNMVDSGKLTKIQQAYGVLASGYDRLRPLWTSGVLGHADKKRQVEVVKVKTHDSIIPNPKRRRKRVLLQLFIIVVLLATAWFIFGQNTLALRKQIGAPELLGELQLIGSYERFDAPSQIGKLLGNDIETVSAYTAVYLGSDKRVLVWVGTVESRDAAAELIKQMTEGIESEDSSIHDVKRLTIAGYEVFSHGGEHFFYDSRKQSKRIVWVTIEAADTLKIVEQVVKSF